LRPTLHTSGGGRWTPLWSGEASDAIEVKLRRGTVTEERALDQVTDYLDHLGLDEGWL
jgi:hypothetical protein